MNIQELRISKGLTQAQVCQLLGMQLRTYQNYESGRSKRDTFKINQIIKCLSEYESISETKGLLSIEEIRKAVVSVCKKHTVSYVYLFGSYAKGKAKENSDVDLLISCDENGFDFIRIMDELHAALHKNIDLLKTKDLSNNIDFIDEILKTGVKIYGENQG